MQVAPRRGLTIGGVVVRAAVLYTVAWTVGTQTFGMLLAWPDRLLTEHAATRLVLWVATHVLGLGDIETAPGSLDRTFDHVQAALFATLALCGGLLWSVLQPVRTEDERVARWWRTIARFSLGSVMAYYGAIKLVPIQWLEPGPTALLTPTGEWTLSSLLMVTLGASPRYLQAVGAVEVLTAVCLFVPALSRLGALAAVVATSHVWVLNVTYDITDKLYATHLLGFALALAWPDLRRLPALIVTGRRTPGWWAQVGIGAWIVGVAVYNADLERRWNTASAEATAPVAGAWAVVSASPGIDWRRLDFELEQITIVRDTGPWERRAIVVDAGAAEILVRPGGEPGGVPAGRLRFTRVGEDRLHLVGAFDGVAVDVTATRLDLASLPLRGSTFQWLQERRR